MGAYLKSNGRKGTWVEAFWNSEHPDKIVDVTGQINIPSLSKGKI